MVAEDLLCDSLATLFVDPTHLSSGLGQDAGGKGLVELVHRLCDLRWRGSQ